MTESEQTPTRKRVDYSDWRVILVGFIPIVILLCCVPVFWFFLPFVVVALVVLYQIAGGTMKKARAIAQRHLNGDTNSVLQADFRPGLSSALVLNDWGVVFLKSGSKPIELPWQDIKLVDETSIANLAFHDQSSVRFQTDMSQDKYFLATKSIYSKIPSKTNFQINPESGHSQLLELIETKPFTWNGKWGQFSITRDGVEYNNLKVASKIRLSWGEISSVVERKFEVEHAASYWETTFNSGATSFTLSSTYFDNKKELGNSDYDLIKEIVHERIPGKTNFEREPPTPVLRAKREFERYYEAAAAGFTIAAKTGKWDHVEKIFRHNLWLLDKFGLEYLVESKKFLQDYSELLTRSNRPEEGEKLLQRASKLG